MRPLVTHHSAFLHYLPRLDKLNTRRSIRARPLRKLADGVALRGCSETVRNSREKHGGALPVGVSASRTFATEDKQFLSAKGGP